MSRSQDFCIRMPEECSSISKSKMGKWLIYLIEGIVFILSLGGLITSLTGKLSQNHVIWFLELWKWCVLGMVIVGGRRIMKWMMMIVVNLVKMVFLFMEVKVYYSYYIYSLGKSIGVALWFGLALVTWVLLFKSSEVKRFLYLANYVNRSDLDSYIQKYITRSLGTLVIGGFLWVLKTLLVNILSSPFQTTRLFEKFRESLIDQYILEAFSSTLNESVVVNWINNNYLPCKTEEKILVINCLKNIEPEEISAWTMNELIKVIASPRPLCPITKELEDLAKKEQDMNKLFIKADAIADTIIGNVTRKSATEIQIEKVELQTFLKAKEANEVDHVVQHIIGTGMQKDETIGKQALKKWLVNATIERRSLAQSLKDTAIAIDELNKLLSVTLLFLLFILWLIMLEVLTTEAFIAVMGHFVALAFIFGDTVKHVFQGIIFVFVKHPFDIGDSCLINGEEMVVGKMNLLSTVFRKNVKDKIMYPNSVLTTLHIKNLYRVNRHFIEDSFEIAIGLFKVTTPTVTERDSSTTTVTELPQIDSLQNAISKFLIHKEGEEGAWLRSHSFKFKEIEDQKLKIVLSVSYPKTGFDSDWAMILDRRHALVKELTKFFAKETGIERYNILPKAVDAE